MIETYDREELRDASLLSHAEARELVALEAVIRRGRAAWIEVTSALARIHEARLYRATHPSFEAYCRDRWNLTRPTAYRMIAAGEVLGDVARMSQLETSGPPALPANQAQALALAPVPPEQRAEAWQRVVETAPEGGITTEHVERVVQEVLPPEQGVKGGAAVMAPLAAEDTQPLAASRAEELIAQVKGKLLAAPCVSARDLAWLVLPSLEVCDPDAFCGAAEELGEEIAPFDYRNDWERVRFFEDLAGLSLPRLTRLAILTRVIDETTSSDNTWETRLYLDRLETPERCAPAQRPTVTSAPPALPAGEDDEAERARRERALARAIAAPPPADPTAAEAYERELEEFVHPDPDRVPRPLSYAEWRAGVAAAPLPPEQCRRCGVAVPADTGQALEALALEGGVLLDPRGHVRTPQGAFYCRACREKVRFCLGCGCTDDAGCPPDETGASCSWAGQRLCSRCAPPGEERVKRSEKSPAGAPSLTPLSSSLTPPDGVEYQDHPELPAEEETDPSAPSAPSDQRVGPLAAAPREPELRRGDAP